MPSSRHVVALLATSALALAAGCGGGDDDSKDQGGSNDGTVASGQANYADGGTFTFALASDPGDLDPSMTPSSVARSILGLAYDTLVYQKEDGTVVSGLAEKWDVTPKSATFTLREGVKCSDGTELTATDVADNISYLGDPANKSPLTGVVVQPGVKATADDAARTVKVTTPKANGFLLTELGGVFIICRAGLDDHKQLAKKTIGTGPWVLDEAVADDRYSFTRHEGYAWGPDGAKLDGEGVPTDVNVRIIPTATTTANLLLNGEVNVGDVNGPDAERLKGAKLPSIDTVDTAGETWFNHAKGRPGADPAVREALAVGSDRDALGKVATGDNAQPSKGFITLQPNPCAGGDTVSGNLPDFDAEAAKKILDEAGYRPGADGIREKDGKKLQIDFIYDKKGLDSRAAGAELLADQWKALGVDVKLRALPEAQLNEVIFGTGAWDAAWSSFTFNLPSQMVAFVSGPTPAKGGANFPGIENAAYSKVAGEAIGKVGKDSCPDWADAEKALLTEHDLIPMFDAINRTYVKNAELTSIGGQVWGASLRLLAG